MKLGPLLFFLARISLSIVFFESAWQHLSHWKSLEMAFSSFPYPSLLVFGTLCVEVLGGLCLFLGFRVRLYSLFLALFFLSYSFAFHDFWHFAGPKYALYSSLFVRDLAVTGALLMMSQSDSGILSLRK